MTQNEKTARLVARGMGVLMALAVCLAALLCMSELDVGGVYHPEGWAVLGQRDLPLLLGVLLFPVALMLLWSRAAAKWLALRWSAALRLMAKAFLAGTLGALAVLALLAALRTIWLMVA